MEYTSGVVCTANLGGTSVCLESNGSCMAPRQTTVAVFTDVNEVTCPQLIKTHNAGQAPTLSCRVDLKCYVVTLELAVVLAQNVNDNHSMSMTDILLTTFDPTCLNKDK